ncbi:MAG: AAA family ATPase, partial [Gallionellaceae bacterium]
MALDEFALEDLGKSGLSAATIQGMGCESHTAVYINKAVRGSDADGHPIPLDGGYSIPIRNVDSEIQAYRFRLAGNPDIKYLSAVGAGIETHVPQKAIALAAEKGFLGITEGEKKAEKSCQEGIPCIAVSGIDCWFDPVARGVEKAANSMARLAYTTPTHPTIKAAIAKAGVTQVVVLGDSDCGGTSEANLRRRKRLEIFTEALRYQLPGVKVVLATCPPSFHAGTGKLEKVGLDDWLISKRTIEVEATLRSHLIQAATTTKTIAVDIGTILNMQFPAREVLVGGWLAKRNLAMVYAARGAGKTLFTIECVVGIVTGTIVFGWPCNPAGCLYIDGEMCIAEMQARFAAAFVRAGLEPIAPLKLINPELSLTMPNLSTEVGQNSVDQILRES